MRLCRAPQVVLASWYRMYTGLMGYLGIPTKTCWSVNRGEGLTPVDSCEGTDSHHGNICLHTRTLAAQETVCLHVQTLDLCVDAAAEGPLSAGQH